MSDSSSEASETPETPERIARLSQRHHVYNTMIPNAGPPPTPTGPPLSLSERSSSLGTLGRLPPEIKTMILGMLDAQSCAYFSRVSYSGLWHIQNNSVYPELVKLVLQPLVAMRKLGLIHLHTVDRLSATLRMGSCATCPQYGPFLFLPTCDRCCWQCLRTVAVRRVFPRKEAMKFFALEKHHVEKLTTIHVIPGNYDLSARPAPDNCKLVAVKEARDLALAVHGSWEALAEFVEAKYSCGKHAYKGYFYLHNWLATPGQDPLLTPSDGRIPADDFSGVASIPFPSLSQSGELDNGLWCLGCHFMATAYIRMRLPSNVLNAVVPEDCSPIRVLLGLDRRARSKEGFLHHIKVCPGVPLFEWDEDHPSDDDEWVQNNF